ncbi:hypothetical protein [Arthrobacter sp. PsM3]|uniref:hypothetical protein n=1 Tax=Arthrobacter sp. PsM3 TaxID=3030531 RepID=UPI00263B64A0|nr:hypothetical protein [Arthrobacter sp. PsM3]MDN4645940.1 hypothetical protein [Arthrobacter sp. PsM3]
MTHMQSVAVTAQATFGRDGAMFEGLLGFVGQLSVVLWGLVVVTAIIRFVGIRIYRRGAASTRLVETEASRAAMPTTAMPITKAAVDLVHPAAAMPTTAMPTTKAAVDLVHPAAAVTSATFDQVLQPAQAPAAVAASVKMPHRAHRNRRAAHVPAFAANSTEA